VTHYNLQEPGRFAKVPDGPQTYILNIHWLQETGAQIRMPKWNHCIDWVSIEILDNGIGPSKENVSQILG
jgi:hypothetical protein